MAKPQAVVITGGLGYVGQSLAAVLTQRGYTVVAIDIRTIESQVPGVTIYYDTMGNKAIWKEITQKFDVTTIYHCAGLIVVSESVEHPARYFHENLVESLAMLDHLREFGPIPLVFSSSAAVYGNPQSVPIPEDAPKIPISPYGVSKWQFEEILRAYDTAYGQPWVALRYFNVAGMVAGVKEQHQPETHLLPQVADALAHGRAPVVFGTDYPTADGTAVRDYIHMRDLVAVHIQAAEYLAQGQASCAFNVGSGRGHSVQEVVQGFAEVLGHPVDVTHAPRRAGDPPVLVADIAQAREILHFDPAASQNVTEMIRDIWSAHRDAGGNA